MSHIWYGEMKLRQLQSRWSCCLDSCFGCNSKMMVMPNFKLGRRTAKTRTLDECPNRPKTPDIFLPWPFAIIVPVTAVQSSSRYRCSWHALLVPLRMCPNFRQPRANIHPKAEFSLPCIANTQRGNGKSTIYCYFPIRTSVHYGRVLSKNGLVAPRTRSWWVPDWIFAPVAAVCCRKVAPQWTRPDAPGSGKRNQSPSDGEWDLRIWKLSKGGHRKKDYLINDVWGSECQWS